MPINKFLELSTAHMKQKTDSILTKMNNPEPAVEMPRFVKVTGHHYGYILFLSNEIDFDQLKQELLDKNISELLPIIRYAIKNKCYLILFDRDAEEMPMFSTFDWEG